MVVVLVFVAGPPHGVLGVLVHDDELILGGAAGVDTGHNVDGTQLADLTLLVAFQTGLGLLFKQLLIRGVIHDLSRAGDTILAQIYLCHDTYTSSFRFNSDRTARTSSAKRTARAMKKYRCVFSCLPLYIKHAQNQPDKTNPSVRNNKFH